MRWCRAWLVIVALMWALAACTGAPQTEAPPGDEAACQPACEGRQCGDDGCGALCGRCEGDAVCQDGQCVGADEPDEPDTPCAQTCQSEGAECGEVCGQVCGTCPEANSACEAGRCVCAPQCAGKVCGDDDGCGGVCAPCPSEANCQDCPMRLTVVEREERDGRLHRVTLALDYAAAGDGGAPTLADIRLAVGGPAFLERVGLGEAALEAEKTLAANPATGQPYQEQPDGTLQFLVLSSQNTTPLRPGRWLFFQFLIGDTAAEGPARFALVKREQTLAPPAADSLLWSAEYDAPVVIWPEVRNAP